MYILLQIRRERRVGKARLFMHTPIERGQRKDLHIPMVLVHNPRIPHLPHPRIQTNNHPITSNASLHNEDALLPGQKRIRRHHRQGKQNGRLVPAVHARREPGLHHLQGHPPRVRQQAGGAQLPLQRGARGVTPTSGVVHQNKTVTFGRRAAASAKNPLRVRRKAII